MLRISLILAAVIVCAASVCAQSNLRPGSAAPDFSAQSLDGGQHDLQEFKGKVVVLTFWTTRCVICVAEIPGLNRVAERYRDKGVVFLAVTMDNEAKIHPFLKKNPFAFTIMPNSFGVMLKYADRDRAGNLNMGFPAHFLITREGTIAHRTDGWDKAANIEAQIARLLGE